MKKIITFLVFLGVILQLSAQDPQVFGQFIDPSPIKAVGDEALLLLCFQNNSTTPLTVDPVEPMRIEITVNKFTPDIANTFDSNGYFEFTTFVISGQNIVRATQVAPIPGNINPLTPNPSKSTININGVANASATKAERDANNGIGFRANIVPSPGQDIDVSSSSNSQSIYTFTCSDFVNEIMAAMDCDDMTGRIEIDFAESPMSDITFPVDVIGIGIDEMGLTMDGEVSGATGDGDLMFTDAAGCMQTLPIVFDDPDCPLPVELTYFNGKTNDCDVILSWQTATEIDFSHFEVERSLDGKQFEAIAKVVGAGNSLEVLDYSYTHTATVKASNYYRLKAVDLTGEYEYSKIILVENNCEGNKEMKAYPNPVGAAQKLQVEIYTENVELQLMIKDIKGRVVHTYQIDNVEQGWNTIELDLSTLPSGTYFVFNQDGEIVKFIKSNE